MATPISNMTVTWNNAGTTFNAIKMNVTDTASNAASLLMNLQVGGSSKFKVDKAGKVFPAGSSDLSFGSDGSQIYINSSGTSYRPFSIQNYLAIALANGVTLGWTSGIGNALGAIDVAITRDAANTLAQRNATNAQTLRVYKSYTDASNYSRLAINNNQIASEAAGTGTLEVTADAPVLNLAQTWNNAAVTFTGLKANVTDTASNAASLLMDLQVGGTSKFKVDKAGKATATTGDSTTGGFRFVGLENIGMYVQATNIGAGSNVLALRSTNGIDVGINSAQFRLQTGIGLGWASGDPTSTAADTILARDAADTLALRRTTNAQTFRVYNTYTDASNYERGVFYWSSNVFRIATENAGTGSSRTIQLYPSSGNVDIIDGSSVAQISFNIQSSNGLRVASDRPIGFTPGGANLASPDTTLRRVAAGILGVRGGLITDAGALSFIEQTAPAAPATNGVYIYAQDNGAGKTQLMARFATGAAVEIAIEP